MGKTTTAETLSFQAEAQQLLDLMIHSLYSHKEIFLRELISNASDACDRLRFESLTNKDLLEDDGELEVRVSFDKKKRTITVADNGIGMDRDEVVENIGTIARSGTKEFMKALTGDQAKDANLIGQFGVGFYSVFIVADKVTLTTRKAGQEPEQGVRWESDGGGEYTVEATERPGRGTQIVLHLRKGENEFLDSFRLRNIIGKYSDHVSLPIRLPKETEDKKSEPEWETVNKGSALWARPKKEISKEDYDSFYTNLTFDQGPPLFHLHNRVEGKLEYISLLYVPARAPFDLWDREHRHGIKLYVRRVFIMDDTKYLMPAYLRFVRGIVDSADLPLNVSRELLQHNKEIDRIRAASVKKILGELKKMAEKDPEKYNKFWDEFGRVLKEGVIEDHDNLKNITELLRFATTKDDTEEQRVSLSEYVGRMPMKQKAIYYTTAENHAAAVQSPHLEVFRKHNVEVLLLSDPVDEWLINHLTEYQDKPLKSVAKGGLDLDDFKDDKTSKKKEKLVKDFEELVGKIKEVLGDKVKDVRLSDRLVDSPACLVADEDDMGANLERILKAAGQNAPGTKPILELNPEHPLIQNLNNERQRLEDWAHVLFDQAALSEGAPLEEPANYVRRINSLFTETLQSK